MSNKTNQCPTVSGLKKILDLSKIEDINSSDSGGTQQRAAELDFLQTGGIHDQIERRLQTVQPELVAQTALKLASEIDWKEMKRLVKGVGASCLGDEPSSAENQSFPPEIDEIRTRLKLYRKLVTAARDGLEFVDAVDDEKSYKKQSKKLSKVKRGLGGLLDGFPDKKSDEKKEKKKQKLLSAIKDMQKKPDDYGEYQEKPQGDKEKSKSKKKGKKKKAVRVAEWTRGHLHSDELVLPKADLEQRFSGSLSRSHEIRRDFRRVAYVLALAAIGTDSEDMKLASARALRLNYEYGQIKDEAERKKS